MVWRDGPCMSCCLDRGFQCWLEAAERKETTPLGQTISPRSKLPLYIYMYIITTMHLRILSYDLFLQGLEPNPWFDSRFVVTCGKPGKAEGHNSRQWGLGAAG